jgi:hypothetical protein
VTVENVALLRFNAGRLSEKAAARIDLKRYIFSAEEMTNYLPDQLGSMSLRPGTQYLLNTYLNRKARYLRFIYSRTDTALIELTDSVARFISGDALITRPAVATAVTNGTFDANVTGWTDSDEAGADSTWRTGGFMGLKGTRTNRAIRVQAVSVAGSDAGVEHALRIVVSRGEVILRVGSSAGESDYVGEYVLSPGTYSFAFSPTGTFHVWLAALTQYITLVDSVTIEPAGALTLPTPWLEDDLPLVNYKGAQSGDIIFAACKNREPQRLMRFGPRSWGISAYRANNGPFRVENISTLSIAPSAATGDITLTSNRNLFGPGHVGALFRLTHPGQSDDVTFTGADQYSSVINVTGVGASRAVTLSLSGTFAATVTLQRSFDEGSTWTDVNSYTSAFASTTYNDGLDNQQISYRMGVKVGNYTSGSPRVTLAYTRGTTDGIARVTAYTSATVVSAVVLQSFVNSPGATTAWAEGVWSDFRGWPSADAFHEGRLWAAGKDRIIGSVSDGFYSYDETIEGDSAPISRTIGSGPVDQIHWLASIQRLAVGGEGAEHFAFSSSLDEPLTVANFNLRAPSTQGSAPVEAEKMDTSAVFVHATRRRIFRAVYDPATYQYAAEDLTVFCPEFGDGRFSGLEIQRQPDTRIWAVRRDGTVGVIVYSRPEFQDVNALCDIETNGGH